MVYFRRRLSDKKFGVFLEFRRVAAKSATMSRISNQRRRRPFFQDEGREQDPEYEGADFLSS